ncbi:MAG TPA: mechanosensitive ion channel protein MscS [Gammaproteobacteria bacterium]|jgi:MscS family membrane protein|nr:mechanosensitive ion channel family protein [Litorivicinus sp.]MDF1782646.1 mechanosensitive ion channel family protein [Litorivicinaceae bacterium]NBR74470.1 mechanosensitive ion channel family protein [Gammaproteobacteria bacterium]HAY54971.1 mechanosensitive ion channel protein MscS [Gammaproteobacteria bacterium]
MLELFIESILSLLEAPLTGIGISPVAVLRGVELFVIVLLTVFGSYFVRRFVRTLKTRATKTTSKWDDTFFAALEGPARTLVWVVGLTFALERASVGLDLQAIFSPLRGALVVATLTWALIRFIDRVQRRMIQDPKTDDLDLTTVEAIGRLIRITVLITSGLIILQTLGFSVSGVLAFGGLGGIAVGFAAKDLLSNFFGGLMIFLDRPFGVGDWIRSPDRDIEGTVESLGWRLTTIRTFDKRPLYVPNATFLSIAVENPSRMSHRRIYETIGVRYDDAAQIRAIVERVKAMLEMHPDIDASQTLMVNFNQFGPSSLDFFLYCFTKTTVWTDYHRVKEDVLLQAYDLITALGAEVAFPTQTLHLQVEPEALPVQSAQQQ